jgi:hypothetical protein
MRTQNPNVIVPRRKPLFLVGFFAAAASVLLSFSTQAASFAPGSLHSVKLGWDAVPEVVKGYRIFMKNSNGQFVALNDSVSTLSYSVPNLEYGKTYHFAVCAVSTSGVQGDLSQALAVSVSTPPLPTGGQLGRSSSGKPVLEWSFPESALPTSPVFKIYGSTNLVTWTLVETITPEQASTTAAGRLNFAWQIQSSAPKMFYKMTSSNWLGDSSAR